MLIEVQEGRVLSGVLQVIEMISLCMHAVAKELYMLRFCAVIVFNFLH
jgi:hypothetical protein